MSALMGKDLTVWPDALLMPLDACRSAALWWKAKGLNALADRLSGAGERKTFEASLPQTAEVPDSLSFWPYALNEITVHRSGAAMLGINVSVNGDSLPTYWADGLLVATSSGSTAYSLSAGGPICTPDAKVLIIAPIAPHNLNVRPLVVPENTRINISTVSRDGRVILTMDNRTLTVDDSTSIDVSVAQFSLKRVRLPKSSFVKALTSKLFWGEDIRNNAD